MGGGIFSWDPRERERERDKEEWVGYKELVSGKEKQAVGKKEGGGKESNYVLKRKLPNQDIYFKDFLVPCVFLSLSLSSGEGKKSKSLAKNCSLASHGHHLHLPRLVSIPSL